MIGEKIIGRFGQTPRNVFVRDHQNRSAAERRRNVVTLPPPRIAATG